jgi:hypothetical protein
MPIRQGESLWRALSPDDVGSAKELAANTVRLPPCLFLARPPQRRRYSARRTRRPPDGPDIMPFLPATRWLALAFGAAGCCCCCCCGCPSLPLRRPSPSHDAVDAVDTLRRGFPRRPCGLSTRPLAHAPTHHPPAPALLPACLLPPASCLPIRLSSLANHNRHAPTPNHSQPTPTPLATTTPCSPPTKF